MIEKNKIKVFEEPNLEFGHNQQLSHPADGLTLFGPYDLNSPAQPKNITYALIGTQQGITQFKNFATLINLASWETNDKNKKGIDKVDLWPPFPGFEAAFHCDWPDNPAWTHILDKNELSNSSKNNDPNKRAYLVVDQYENAIKIAATKKDENFKVIICIVPDEIYQNCRPQSRITDGVGIKPSKKALSSYRGGQHKITENSSIEIYQFSEDFRRQIKARAMKFGIPIQIIRESTLIINPSFSERKLTPLSDRLWNLSTAIYYKAGGKPWKLATARSGVSYIGIAFKKATKEPNSRTGTSAAQMFLDTGDGIVFLGDEGQWYSPEDKQYHLTKDAAKKLLLGTIETYKQLEGQPLKEIFLHSKSDISQEEFAGYNEACPENAKLVGIRVKPEKVLKLYRGGSRPVLRGTFLKENDKTAYVWGTGFKERLGTYDGWEVPNPLRVDIQHGEADIEQVCKDILSLTKLNYNSCKLGDLEPVTIKFSDAVGEILINNKGAKIRMPQFKFYV